MGREDPQLKLRLPEEMKHAITAAAKENNRSVNSEIVARLSASLSSGRHLKIEGKTDLTDSEKEEIWQWMKEREDADARLVPNKTDAGSLGHGAAPSLTDEVVEIAMDALREAMRKRENALLAKFDELSQGMLHQDKKKKQSDVRPKT